MREIVTRRGVLGGGVGLAGAALLAACGQAATPTPAPAKPAEAPGTPSAGAKPPTEAVKPTVAAPEPTRPAVSTAAPPKVSGPVTLTWDNYQGIGTPYPDETIKAFRNKNPNVTVEHRPLPTSQIDSYPKLYAMYAAGNIGDVFSFDPVDYEFYRAVPQGVIRSLDDYIAADKYDLKQFFDTFMDLQRVNGKVWGLPSYGHPGDSAIVVNEVALSEAGLKVPDHTSPAWTMDAFYELVVKLHKAAGGRVERYGANFPLSARSMTIVTRAFSGDIISPDGKKATVADPAGVKGLRWTYDLAQKEKVLALPGGFEGTAQSLFALGKLGLTQTSAVGMFNVMDASKDPKVARARTVLVPRRPDGIFPSQTRAGNWTVGAKSKSPEPSWEFVKHQSSREGCLLFTKLSKASVGCVRPDVLDDPFFAEPNFQPLKEMLLRALPNYAPANYRGTEYQDAFGQTHSLMYLGRVPFDQGVKDLSDALQRVLDKPAT